MKMLIPSTWVVCLAAACGAAGSPVAFAEDGAARPAADHVFAVNRWTAKEQKIVDALDRTLTESWSFVDMPLSEVLAMFAESQKIQIVPDKRSLEDAQINLDEEKISIAIADVKLRSALHLILDQFELAYVIEDEVMKILWQDDAENRLTTVVYDVCPLTEAGYTEADMLFPIQNETTGPWFPDDPNKRIDVLIGGLSIRQTGQVHDEVEALLQGMLKLTQRPAQAKPRDGRDGAALHEPEKPAEPDRPDAQDGVTAHPIEPGQARRLRVGMGVRPRWHVVIYDVTALTEKGYDIARLCEVVRTVVHPEDWDETATLPLHGGLSAIGGQGGGFFAVPSIPETRKTSANETVRQFGGGTGGMGMGGMGMGGMGQCGMGQCGGAVFSQAVDLHAHIEPLGNTLVVYHAPSVHEAIESFLKELQRIPSGAK